MALKIRSGDTVQVIVGQGLGQAGQGAACRAEEEPPVRRGPQHRQAPPAPALAEGHAARRQGRRRDREGGPDPRLQRDARRSRRTASRPASASSATPTASASGSRSGPNTKLAKLMAARLKERYESEIKPAADRAVRLQEPDAGSAAREDHAQHGRRRGEGRTPSLLDAAAEQLGVIAGQKPPVRRARKSIANFKLRQGMPVGVKVTLRGERMWEMLDRLQSIAIPRIRDFRGLNPTLVRRARQLLDGHPGADHLSRDRLRLDRPGAGPRRHDHDHRRDRRGGVRAAPPARHAVPQRRAPGPTAGRGCARRSWRPTRSELPRSRPPRSSRPSSRREDARSGAVETASEPQPEASADEPPARRQARERVRSRWQRHHRASASSAEASTRHATTIGAAAAAGARAYYRKFGLCRICLREIAHEGMIPGMTKSSW